MPIAKGNNCVGYYKLNVVKGTERLSLYVMTVLFQRRDSYLSGQRYGLRATHWYIWYVMINEDPVAQLVSYGPESEASTFAISRRLFLPYLGDHYMKYFTGCFFQHSVPLISRDSPV